MEDPTVLQAAIGDAESAEELLEDLDGIDTDDREPDDLAAELRLELDTRDLQIARDELRELIEDG